MLKRSGDDRYSVILYPLFLKVNTVMLMHHRITLEDDDEDEDLDVEPAPRRPVLVISDSLKEGLQRGISDILPHKVAQSVYVILILLLECLMLNELIRNMTCVPLVSFLLKKLKAHPPPISFLFFIFFQEPFLHGAGVVAAARRSLLSEEKGLIPETAQTTDSISATPDSMSISHPSQSLQPTCGHTLSSVQLSCGPQLWGGGHGNVIVLNDYKSQSKRLGM